MHSQVFLHASVGLVTRIARSLYQRCRRKARENEAICSKNTGTARHAAAPRAAIKQKKSQYKMDHLERARAFFYFYFFIFRALQVCIKALAALVGLFTCIIRSLYTHAWLAALHAFVILVTHFS